MLKEIALPLFLFPIHWLLYCHPANNIYTTLRRGLVLYFVQHILRTCLLLYLLFVFDRNFYKWKQVDFAVIRIPIHLLIIFHRFLPAIMPCHILSKKYGQRIFLYIPKPSWGVVPTLFQKPLYFFYNYLQAGSPIPGYEDWKWILDPAQLLCQPVALLLYTVPGPLTWLSTLYI